VIRDRRPEWQIEDTQMTLPVFTPGDSFVVFSRAGTAHIYRVGLSGALVQVAGPVKKDSLDA
jgi:hypothetical protein